ncbi:MAG: transposase [Chloroflexi bacterium]|nr:transposase [Chloroflexota bacterium]
MDFPITELMDREACIEWLEKCFHPNGLKCPHCQAGIEQALWFRKTKRSDLDVYRCKKCRGIYTLYSGTAFEGRYFTPEQTILFLREALQGKSSAKLAREMKIKGIALCPFVERFTRPEATLYTDEYDRYNHLQRVRHTVCHSKNE